MIHAFAPLALAFAGLQGPAPSAQPGPDLSFLSGSTVLWYERSAVVPLRMGAAVAEDSLFEVTSSDPSIVRVLGPARALGGEATAFVRVRAAGLGTATLEAGGATLDVRVDEARAEAPVRRPEPTIVAPARGSYVWGTFAVGVELPPAVEGLDEVVLELVTDRGGRYEPREVEPTRGPERRVAFDVDAGELAPGSLVLRARATRGDSVLESDELTVEVLHPGAGDIQRFEWEDTVDDERPEGYEQRPPSLAGDPAASGGRSVVVRGFQPMPLLRVEVPVAGRWQAMARLRGDLGAGAFPTVALSLDAPYTYPTSVRAIDRRWHRLPVGPPIELSEGPHVVGLRLSNAANVGRAESRHLYVDTLELVRVPDATAAAPGMMSMQAMSMEESAPSMTAMAPAGMASTRSAPVAGDHWIGLHTVFDGLPMTGKMTLEGVASWTGGDAVAAPVTELVVDGETLAVTQTDEPIFTLWPGELGPGAHDVALRSRQPGRGVRETPGQVLVVADDVVHRPGRREHRITTRDERWRVVGDDGTPADLAHPSAPIEATIDLPAQWEGRFEARIDARGPGDPRRGEAYVRIEQEVDGEVRVLAEDTREIKNWWSERRLGELTFQRGPKRLTLRLTPDDSGERGADTLYVRSLVFERLVAEPRDVTPPVARIVYPGSGHTAAGLDAVVVEAHDNEGIASVELLVDGRPVGSFARAPQGAGRIVLPLWADEIAPGDHVLSVRVLDASNHQCDSAEVAFVVAEAAPAEPGPFRRAVHLLDRLAFGPSTQDLAELLARGETAWLERALERDAGDRVATGLARATLGAGLPYGASQHALHAALMTNNPLRSRFVFFVDNHFSTWGGKTGVTSEYGDHLRWQKLGFAPFSELLLANVTNPVMLVYLDQQQSFRGRLNENFARELLELHTVGAEGGYDQQDVTELAGLLTGLTVSEEAPITGAGQYRRRVLRYAPDLASPEGADVMGMRFEALPARAARGGVERTGFERVRRIAEHLAAHPMTARYWGTRMAEYYVSDPAPAALVDDLARVFHASGGDPRELLRCIAGHPEFLATIDTPRIATPFDFAVRLGRATAPRHVRGPLDQYMKASGMGLFDHAAPDGYPTEDAAWVDSNALLARWRVAQQFPWATRLLAPEEVRRSFGDGLGAWQERAIDHAAFALLGRRLGEESTASAMGFMAELDGEPGWKRVDQMTVLMTRLPEASLR